jgi:hypothetical protein
MRYTILAALFVLIFATANAADSPAAIYSPDPNHLWNRLYDAMATRTVEEVKYGADISEPYPDDFDDHARLIATLDEFLATLGNGEVPGELPRALLLNDVWTAFDVSIRYGDNDLQVRLARAIERLGMPASAVAGLPDNYAQAAAAQEYAKDFDPSHPEVAFLPPDLFDPNGPWVQIGESGRDLTAPTHVQMVSGRSAFFVFMRCPGGRKATLAYLEQLNLHPTPWQSDASIGTRYYPDHRKVRMSVLQPHPNTPRFPEGTVVALVRRMMVVDEKMDPVLTPITQKVQFRVYRKQDAAEREAPRAFDQAQSIYEFVMRRKELIAGVRGGLHLVTHGEKEYQALLVPMRRGGAEYFAGPVVLQTCKTCHSGENIFSVRSYLGENDSNNPQLLPADRPDYQGMATASWKKMQFNWGVLKGILAAQRSR